MALTLSCSIDLILPVLERITICRQNVQKNWNDLHFLELQNELVHSVETRAPKWIFTIALKMEGSGEGGTLSDENRGNPWSRGREGRGLRSRMQFPGNQIFPEKIKEISRPEHWGTTFSQSQICPVIRDWLLPGLVLSRETFRNSRTLPEWKLDFPERYWVVPSRPVYFPDFSRIFSSNKTRKSSIFPVPPIREMMSGLVLFKMSSGTQTPKGRGNFCTLIF